MLSIRLRIFSQERDRRGKPSETQVTGNKPADFGASHDTKLDLGEICCVHESSGPGVAAIYLAVGFMIPFTLWFGAWGAIAAYLGCFVGAGILSGIPADVSFYWSFADFWQVLIPVAAFRKLNADVSLRTKRDFLVLLVFGWALNNLIGAGWGSTTLAIGRVIRWDNVPSTLVNWFASNLVVTAIITPLLLRFLTPYVRRAYVKELLPGRLSGTGAVPNHQNRSSGNANTAPETRC